MTKELRQLLQMVDLSQFAAPVAREKQSHAPLDSREEEAMRLRAKIGGVLIRQSRLAASRSIEDCADRLQVSPELVAAWEYGDDLPSPPQLERLASYLNVPVRSLSQDHEPIEIADVAAERDQSLALRQRLLGGLLRVARDLKGMSIAQLSEMTAIDKGLLQAYEYGERVIPMNHLLLLANALDRDLEYFLESGYTSDAETEPESAPAAPVANTEDKPRFAVDQKTQGIIKLAVAFSQIPSEELHRIADALLSISRAKSGPNGA
ncbi:MAG: helix-turn-helix transcriptional regulator [Chloroflexi bacterium]|nr:helix-turn-helix transcriptional regulator [Chloroflexota bacterium]